MGEASRLVTYEEADRDGMIGRWHDARKTHGDGHVIAQCQHGTLAVATFGDGGAWMLPPTFDSYVCEIRRWLYVPDVEVPMTTFVRHGES